jgi:DNA (cytosine-5)-methyltransferase 1
MAAYYNEWEPYPAQWLRNLIKADLIAPGDVDERSIKDVKANDLKSYTQCHFFAGIGGWSYALRLAGWEDSRPVWTGSCPCQPFACSGKRKSSADERHLWPAFYTLIAECRPATIFGEQVGSKDGREWLAAVRCDLEETEYAVGGGRIPASALHAPHERQRLWFVANYIGARSQWSDKIGGRFSCEGEVEKDRLATNSSSGQQRQEIEGRQSCNKEMATASSDTASLGCMETRSRQSGTHNEKGSFTNSYETGREDGQMESRLRASEVSLDRCPFLEAWQDWNGGFGGFGRLDDGVSPRVAKSVVGGFGNAIVPQVAQAFIEAFLECRP